ncbi:MAG: aminotransferase class V-fold PLP-dependent enzyme [Clostridia bacterium]|nr:aminotransferase class V-fold PLP-dependent enzyme [Clostridia bacterium]
MTTPICDFVRRYAESGALRLHMPGHKGSPVLGMEQLDITEIDGADSLYEASGIIRESEDNAAALFGAPTFYSTEGSSHCIRAMLYLALLHAQSTGQHPTIAAGRNAHKTFLSAAALLDFDVRWLPPEKPDSYLSCPIDGAALNTALSNESVAAVYITSPDYLGNTADIAALAKVCHAHGALLLVDNAHGGYLRFLPESRHPIDLGADLCCDSAHKTLPVLTGGAYLHIATNLPPMFAAQAKQALALFGSTSPSYLIMQSLDAANALLATTFPQRLKEFLPAIAAAKKTLAAHGYTLRGDEPLKITIAAKNYGYTGKSLADALLEKNIVSEFADPDFLVLMLPPDKQPLERLIDALTSLPRRPAITDAPPAFTLPERVLSIREAAMSVSETLPAAQARGRVLAAATVGCPPAVPIVVCGERINEEAIQCFNYYGIEEVTVVS